MQFCKYFGYQAVLFTANHNIGEERFPIYHTNVMMCLADKFAIICLDSIDDKKEKNDVIEILNRTNKEIIEITESQKNRFAMGDKRYLVMSTSAFNSLDKAQIIQIEKHCSIIHSSLDTIEACGGGSARCMMAENFLPKE